MEIIDPSLISDTQDKDHLLTEFFYENLVLREKLGPLTTGSNITPVSLKEVVEEEKYYTLRKYLQMTGPEPQAKRHLIIANGYPDVGLEYNNGFVHKRVLAYREAGLTVDVVAYNKRATVEAREFEGVPVLSGYVAELNGLMSVRDYASVSMHMFNGEMWSVVSAHADHKKFRKIIYLHGYESKGWMRYRREFTTMQELAAGIMRSFVLRETWENVLTGDVRPDAIVSVSNFWLKGAADDMRIFIPKEISHVIPNYIDNNLFSYEPKDAAQRFRILWLRSANTYQYGADLAAPAFKEILDSRFGDKVEIKIVGDGKHFHLFEDEFGEDPRVSIERRFVKQDEMARLFREYGVFMVPTRIDTHGVARDEAMSSGMVPLTNAVTAIPEYADETCAILAPDESYKELVDGCLKLFEDPDLFLRMSRAAAERARSQCTKAQTIGKEIDLMEASNAI